jgi:hypothetical protein
LTYIGKREEGQARLLGPLAFIASIAEIAPELPRAYTSQRNEVHAMLATDCENLKALYLDDETAWLEAMADVIARKELSELDLDNLREYLTDMAIRDRREVRSRLVALIAHQLKWQMQPARRSTSWRLTIEEQRDELGDIFEGSKTLAAHAETVLQKAFRSAVKLAAIETEIPESKFPKTSQLSAREWVALPLAK